MTLVSSKEFIADEDKYFDLALNGGVCIQRGDFVYHLVSVPFEKQYPPQPFLEPDEDLRRAITAEELLERIHKDIHRKFASRK